MAKSPAFSALVREARIQNSLGNHAVAPLEVASRILESSIEAADGRHIHQVPPKGLSSLPRNSVFSSVSIGLGRSSETSEAAAVRQTEREDLSVARAKASKTRGAQQKNSISSVTTPYPHTLIVQPGSGLGAASPMGKHPKAHRQSIITWRSRRIFQKNWCSRCKKTRPRRHDEQ
jgi:hypothetical protein